MQQATTLPAIVRLGYISPNVKGFMVSLDMAPTGATLNPVGQRAWLQLAQAFGLTPTVDGITTYSLATAATVARRLALIGQDRRFQGR